MEERRHRWGNGSGSGEGREGRVPSKGTEWEWAGTGRKGGACSECSAKQGSDQGGVGIPSDPKRSSTTQHTAAEEATGDRRQAPVKQHMVTLAQHAESTLGRRNGIEFLHEICHF